MYVYGRECKIIRDQQTLKSKGYGFVSFVNKEVGLSFRLCEILATTPVDFSCFSDF